MDPISFAASLLTLVDVSSTVVRYLSDIQQGGKTREKLLNELIILEAVLGGLKDIFDPRLPNEYEPWMQPLKVLIEPPGHNVVEQIREELTGLEKKLTGPSTRAGKVLTTLRWPLEQKQALQTINRVQRLKETASLALSQSNHQLHRDVRSDVHDLKSVVEDTQFQTVLNWLSPINFRQKQQEIRGTAESCLWILQDESFRSWHSGDRPLLWCHGPPGAGKSVLAASLFDEIIRMHKDHQKVAVLIAFCSFDNEGYQTAQSVVASLLKQAVQLRGILSPELREEHSKSLRQDGTKADLNRLKQLFRQELANFETTFIIFDGLDEANNVFDRPAIIAALNACGPLAKVLLTSRYSEDIATSVTNTVICKKCHSNEKSKYWRCINCEDHVLCEGCSSSPIDKGEPDGSHPTVRQSSPASMPFRPKTSDIRKYVMMRIETEANLKRLVESQLEFKETIVSTVVARSEKLFLLARLHMDTIADCFTERELRQHLDTLTGDLSEIYEQARQRMRRERHGEQRILEKMLMWVSCAKRPLSLQELSHAMSIVPGLDRISQESIIPVDTIREVITWTVGLISVDARSLVRFIHPTTARFFQDTGNHFPNGDTDIARACLHYLNIDSVQAPLPDKDKSSHFKLRIRQFPFLEYAIIHTWQHVARSAPKDDDFLATVFLRSHHDFLTQALYFLDPTWSIGENASPVHIASHFGLADVLTSLLSDGDDANARDSFGATPLMYAVQSRDGALPCVKTLLSAAADPSLRCREGSTALLRAIYGEDESIVDCLLEARDVAINAVTTRWKEKENTALLLSLRLRNKNIFQKLLSRPDIDINARISQDLAILHHASMRSSRAWALEALLAHPKVDVDIESHEKYTPLCFAAENGHRGSAEQLLARGADLEHRDASQGSILMRAADEHESDMVLFLINKGADIHHRDFLGRNVLHSATTNRAWGCLQILLMHTTAIDVNCQGTDGKTPLHDACKTRDAHGVKLLVAAGARCDILDGNGYSPVYIARVNGATEALQILETAAGYEKVYIMPTTKTLLDAVVFDTIEVIKERIKTASPEELNKASATRGPPVSRACAKSRADVVRMLLQAGADPEVASNFGRTPLFFAITEGNQHCVDALISAGADIDRSPFPGADLPWEYALQHKKLAACFLLIERGARIAPSSPHIQNALLNAAAADNLLVVRRLIEGAGASIYLKREGLSAFQTAETNKATRVLSYFAEIATTQRVSPSTTDDHGPANHSDDVLTSDKREYQGKTTVSGTVTMGKSSDIREVFQHLVPSSPATFTSASIVVLVLFVFLLLVTPFHVAASITVCALAFIWWRFS